MSIDNMDFTFADFDFEPETTTAATMPEFIMPSAAIQVRLSKFQNLLTQTSIENFLESALVVQNALSKIRHVEIPRDIQTTLFDILYLIDKNTKFDSTNEHQSLR